MTETQYDVIGERVYTEKLPNGLDIFVVPKRGFSKSSAYFAVNYGGADRRYLLDGSWVDTPQGVAHFLEHKMFDTEDGDAMTKLSINGASPNAFTSNDLTAYYFDCAGGPAGGPDEMFAENLEILLSFVSTPYFTPGSVEKEQGIIAQEILMGDDDPDHRLYYGLMESLFSHNPVRDSVAGTIDSISRIDADLLYKCHKAFYNPSNMALCVVGDIDPGLVADCAYRTLPAAPAMIPERDYGPEESLSPRAKSFTKNMEVSLPVFLAGCKVKPAAKGSASLREDLVSALALEVLAGHSSPLYLRLYEEGLVSSDFSASYDSAAGSACVIFGGETRRPEHVFEQVLGEVSRLARFGPDKELFGRLKKVAIGSYIRMLGSFDAICGSIVGSHFRGYDAFKAMSLLPSINSEDVTIFIRENIIADNMALSVVLPILT